jgi:hypothetical protein
MNDKLFEEVKINKNNTSYLIILIKRKIMLEKEELEKIEKEVELEFPNEFNLQQVHMVRKIIAKEAEKKALSYLEYIKQCTKEMEVV